MIQYLPLRHLFLMRMRLFFREPEALFWVYGFPLLMIVGVGVAFTGRGAKEVRVRVSAAAEADLGRIASVLEAKPGFVVRRVPLEEAEAVASGGPWDLTVIGRDGRFEYHCDPTVPESHSAHARVNRVLQEAAGRTDEVPTEVRHESVPGNRYIDWLIPGLLGLNIMGGGLWGVGFVAVDLRIRKLLKRFNATPMRRAHFLLSLMGGRLVFLLPEIIVVFGTGWLAFGLRIQGGILSLLIISLVGAASFAGIGLLVASRAQKLETISGLMNAVMLPMWILSGVFFGAERFPAAMQPVVQALPLTQLNNALRGVVLQGHGVHQEWQAVAILLAWGGAAFPLAMRWFRWQ